MAKMTKTEQLYSSKILCRESEWILCRMILVLPLSFLLFMTAHSVIVVRGFSTIPATVRGVRMKYPITITSTLSGDRSTIVGSNNRRTSLIGSSSTTTALKAGLFGEQAKTNNKNNAYISPTSDWQIYVDQSKASLDRGGGAIFDAFISLCDATVTTNGAFEIQVLPAILPKPASGGKGPWIRCIWNTNNQKNLTRPSPNLDVVKVDSVEKVYRVLTTHLGVTNLSLEACECLKWKYKGNTCLESSEIKQAINAYNQALDICEDSSASNSDPNSADTQSHSSIVLKKQEGIVLLLRASAFLEQAQSHKEALKTEIGGDEINLPSSEALKALLSDALFPSSPFVSSESYLLPTPADDGSDDGMTSETDGDSVEKATFDLASETDDVTVESGSNKDDEESRPLSAPSTDTCDGNSEGQARDTDPQTAVRLSVLRKLQSNGKLSKVQLRKIQYRHGLYQTSLLQAARDSLRATEVLPNYPTAWLRAGEILSELWKIKESKQYYEKALSIDESLERSLGPVLEGLRERQGLVDDTLSNNEWPEDFRQLALDIAV